MAVIDLIDEGANAASSEDVRWAAMSKQSGGSSTTIKGLSSLTRREALVGSAAVVAGVALANAAGPAIDHWFEFADDRKRNVVLLRSRTAERSQNPRQVAPPPTLTTIEWPRRLFGERATFKIERRASTPDGSGFVEPQSDRSWPISQLTIRNCSLPTARGAERTTFTLVLTLTRSSDGQTTNLTGVLTPGWGNRTPIGLGASGLPVDRFIRSGDGEARAKIAATNPDSTPLAVGGVLFSAPLPKARMNGQFLPRLFGQRVECDDGARIGFDLDMNLHVDVDRTSKPNSTIKILDLPLAFENLVVRREFAGADDGNTHPVPVAPASQSPSRATSTGLFDDELRTWRPIALRSADTRHNANPDATTGLYGFLFGFKLPGGASNALLDFEVGNLLGPTRAKRMSMRARIDTHQLMARPDEQQGRRQENTFQKIAESRIRRELAAVLRHRGDPNLALSGMRWQAPREAFAAIGDLRLIGEPGKGDLEEGQFPFRSFDIIRQRTPAGTVDMRFRFEPSARETRVRLHRMQIDVSGLPPAVREPGLAQRVPPITAETRDRGEDNRELTAFSASLALHAASVAAPDRIDTAGKPVRGSHTTRLEFLDAEVSLFIPALRGSRPDPRANARIPVGPADESITAAIFDMDRATLRLARAADLLSLKFRFAGLALTVPWRGSADAVATLGPPGGASQAGPATPPAARQGQAVPEGEAASTPRPVQPRATVQERRPLLIVEFPPQHVLEQAFFRQLPTATPPGLRLPPSPNREQALLHIEFLRKAKSWNSFTSRRGGTSTADRKRARRALLQLGAEPDHPKASNFLADFTALARRRKLPAEQTIYAGPEFLDADAHAVAVEVVAALASGPEVLQVPDVDLPAAIVERLKKQLDEELASNRAGPSVHGCQGLTIEHAKRTEAEKDRLDPEYAAFRREFADAAKGDPEREQYFGTYYGGAWFREVRRQKDGLLTEKMRVVLRGFRQADREAIGEYAEARISGPSRIAFHVNTDDHEGSRAGGAIPFTVEGLTNWASMDMAVIRRADSPVLMPERGAIQQRGVRQRSESVADYLAFHGISSADASTVRYDAALRRDGWEKWRAGPRFARPYAYRTIEQRMGEVYAGVRDRPDDFVTAIELPARLHLSPSADAHWKTPSRSVRRAALAASLSPDEAARSDTRDTLSLFHELWTARLAEVGRDGGVRAIWSPDFRAEALLGQVPQSAEPNPRNAAADMEIPAAPPRGPYRPWAIPRSSSQRSSDTEFQRLQAEQYFRTAMDAYDRHELVVLTSVHGLPVLGARDFQQNLVPGGGQIEPPDGYRLRGIQVEKRGPGSPEALRINRLDGEVDVSAIYRPDPLSVSELSLSALGGTLDLNTDFVPPVPMRTRSGANLFDALAIERWRHKAVLGRDILVEIVYKGFLFPTGHPASLVKVTERRFVPVDGQPVAVLVQRKFLRFRKPAKEFPALGQPNRGRRLPLSQLTLLTRQTPDLVDVDLVDPPSVCEAATSVKEENSGRLTINGGTGLCFWPRVRAEKGGEYWFEMRADKENAPVRLPLIFVDNTAANDPRTMELLAEYYNNRVPSDKKTTFDRSGPTRRMMRGDQPVIMAPETKPGDATFDTNWWILGAEGLEGEGGTDSNVIVNAEFKRTSFMLGQDQPPFYPFVETARCRFTQIERFAGAKHGWRDVKYEAGYVREGFPDEPNLSATRRGDDSEIFLTFVKQVDDPNGDVAVAMELDDRGDLSGGVAMPSMNFIGMSRKLGPVGGNKNPKFSKSTTVGGHRVAAPPAESADLSALKSELRRDRPDFNNILGDGKLLGIVKLSDAIQAAKGLLEDHPKLKETVDYGAAQLQEGAESAREFLTPNVLKPAAKLVTDVKREWSRFASRTVEVGEETFGLDKAFPEIGSDIQRLDQAITDALSPAKSETEFLRSLSEIYEAGKRLVRTIDRISKDPMAAMSSEQLVMIKSIRTRIAQIKSFEQQVKGGFDADLVRPLREALFNQKTGPALRRFIFELPIPPVVLPAPPPGAAAPASTHLTALAKAVDDAVVAALDDVKTILDSAAIGSMLPRLREAAEAFPVKLRKAVEVAAAAAEGDLKSELESLRKRLDETALEDLLSPAAMAVAQALEAQSIFEIPAKLDTLARRLKGAAGKDIGGLLGALREDFPKLFDAIGEWVKDNALRQLAPEISSVCQNINAAIEKMFALVLPTSRALTNIANCLESVTSAAPSNQCQDIDSTGQFATAMVETLRRANEFADVAAAAAGGLLDQGPITKLKQDAGALATEATEAAKHLRAVADIASSLRPATPGAPPPPPLCALPTGFNAVHDGRLLAQRTAVLAGHIVKAAGHLQTISDRTLDIVQDAASKAPTDAAGALFRRDAAKLIQSAAAMGSGLARSIQQLMAGLQTDIGSSTSFGPAGGIAQWAALLRTTAEALPDKAKSTKGELERIANAVDAIAKSDSKLFKALRNVNEIAAELLKLQTLPDDPTYAQLIAAAKDIGGQLSRLTEHAQASVTELKTALHGPAVESLLRIARALTVDALDSVDITAPLNFLARPANTVLGVLVNDDEPAVLNRLKKSIDELNKRIETLMNNSLIAKKMLESLARQINTKKLLIVAPPGKEDGDLLEVELKYLSDARTLLGRDPAQFVEAWSLIDHIGRVSGPGSARSDLALVQLVNRFARIDADLLRHVVLDVLDLRKLRDELEQLIRELVPTRVRLAYDLDTEMKAFREILVPVQGQRLTITMRSEIDLLAAVKNPAAPKFSVRGDVGRFEVRLLGGAFHAVSLHFKGFTFTAGSGQSPDFKVNFDRVEVGKDAEFLKQLQDYMSPKGDGLFIKPLESAPGIEAGYGLSLGSFGVGYLSFSNVTLNASAELPFSKGNAALFKVSVGRPDAPFLISSTIFGGGGFLAIIAEPKGFVGLEGSFDFGGVFAFGFGPLTGSGQITVGVTFSARRGQGARLGGVFMVRGQANIACFGVAASLVVRLRYVDSAMQGEATFTYSFSIGIGDVEFSVSVKNNQGQKLGTGESPGQSAGGSGDKANLLNLPGQPRLLMYASASNVMSDAGAGQPPSRRNEPPKAYLRADVVSRRRQWKKFHAEYFAKLPEGADA